MADTVKFADIVAKKYTWKLIEAEQFDAEYRDTKTPKVRLTLKDRNGEFTVVETGAKQIVQKAPELIGKFIWFASKDYPQGTATFINESKYSW